MAKVLPFFEELSRPDFEETLHCLRVGGVVSLPTESFYALSASATHLGGTARVQAMKQQPPEKPILVLIGNRERLSTLVSSVPSAAIPLMDRFWPGPLTLIFPASSLPSELTGGTRTIGIRQPGNAKLCSLLCETGPLTGTSANRYDHPSPRTAQEVQETLGEEVDLILDAGSTPGGLASTVLTLHDGIHVIREGPISIDQIREYLLPLGLHLA